MSQSPTPSDHWPILRPGPARYELLATPAGPVLATADATVTGWRIRTTGPTIRRASTRHQALGILASLAGQVECHCGWPLRWRWRPGHLGEWSHERPPVDEDCPLTPADHSWQIL